MKRSTTLFSLGLLPFLLGACGEVQSYGNIAVEGRRAMNDLQAKASLVTVCDIAVGSYYRVLSADEQRYVTAICGGTTTSSTSSATATLTVPIQVVPQVATTAITATASPTTSSAAATTSTAKTASLPALEAEATVPNG